MLWMNDLPWESCWIIRRRWGSFYNLNMWDDLTVYLLSKEYTINDYPYKYWTKFIKHLETSNEAHQYQLTFNSYIAAKTSQRKWYLSIGMRKNSKFLNRLSAKVQHSKIDLFEFLTSHSKQYGYFKHTTSSTCFFIYKYLLQSYQQFEK
jgi:hypothetical protein